MVDYSKPWACQGCGQMITSGIRHNFEDCEKWKASLRKLNDVEKNK